MSLADPSALMLAAYGAQLEFRWAGERDLTKMRCSALLIQGFEDQYDTRSQLDAMLERVSGPAIIMLDDCGHSPNRAAAEAVLNVAVVGEWRIGA